MRYHYLRGTGRRVRARRLQYAGASSLIVITLCVSMLVTHRSPASSSRALDQAAGSQSMQASQASTAGLRNSDCGGSQKHTGLSQSSLSQFRKLHEYEYVCGGAITNHVSFFQVVPTTTAEAVSQAKSTVTTLKEFARFGISPVVFLEPRTPSGQIIDLQVYQSGGYDGALDTYFMNIRAAGITDAQMGLWVPMPEANVPVWGNTNPRTFTDIYVRTVGMQKKYFPASKAAVLLEAKTYPNGDNWSGGTAVSLAPYVQGIPHHLVDSFGIQGFPYGPSGVNATVMVDTQVYLRTDLALEAAQILGVNEVWFNSGTFRYFGKYPGHEITLTPVQRQTALDGVVAAAKTVKDAGLQTAIHLFAKDKTGTAEKTDWSYWAKGQMDRSPSKPVLKTLVSDAKKAGIPLWFYDYE